MSQGLPQFFYTIFDPSLPRLGPGDDASTIKALDMVYTKLRQRTDLLDPEQLRILDIGCGNGTQTIQLATYTDAVITAVDNHQPYLDELLRRAGAAGLSRKIKPSLGDMSALDREPESFDIVWAEGALFIMGFTEGLAVCHDLLAPHGILAASELAWLRDDPPAECRDYFANVYPDITGIDENLAVMRRCGFEVLEHFVLPESAWWVNYYHPLEHRLQSLRAQYAGEPEPIELIDSLQWEIDVYRKYSNYYGNVFYIMQRR